MEQSVKKMLPRTTGWLRKLRRISGLTLIMLMAIVINVQASTYSETVKFDLKMKKVSLKEVFQTITNQSEFKFVYNNDVVDDNQRVTVTTEDARVEEILDEILPKHDLEYRVIDRQVIVFPADAETETVTPAKAQQEKTINGKVVDGDDMPLPGVSVVVKGTSVGIVTNVDGEYRLSGIPEDANVLVFSFVGMKPQEIAIGGKSTINVTLEEDFIGLDEVIAVGYATQKKANIVGSVASVNGDKIASIPAPDISNALSGRLPGTTVRQQSGEPGQNEAQILVRGRTTLGDHSGGSTAPLVVVDGVPGRSLNDIDPVDIETITVLKDAAAAIYGAQAANGVILVTTKRGETGKPRLSYQFYQGFMTPTILPKTTSAGDYATMLSEYQDYENRNRTYSDDDIDLYYSGRDPWEHPNSRWTDDLVEDWTTTSKHNVTLDGGVNKMRYYVSFGYKNEEAIYKAESSNYKQYNLRAKIELPITDWLTTSVDYAGFLNNKLYPTKSAGSIYGQSTRLVPTQWSYWPTGEPGPDIEYGDNPVVTSTFETGTDDTKNYKNQFTFRGTITPKQVEGLSIEGMYSYDVDNQYRKVFQKPWTLYFPNWDDASRDSEGFVTSMPLTPVDRGLSGPQLTETYTRRIKKLARVSANYSRDFGDHSMSLFGAYEQIDQDQNGFDAFRKYYISDVVQTLDAGADKDKDNGGWMWIYARKSWIGRANYSYKGKYLAEFLYRRDGSVKYPKDSRWGNFPGFLVGWRASEENFWKENINFVNYFKLRGSYGVMGMDPGNPFQYINKYQLNSGMTLGTGKVVETVVQQSGVANPIITWEKQTTYNLGFDSQILENTFHLNGEFFYSKRSDILTARNASVPGFTGLALPDENIAEVDNRGFELDGGYHKDFGSDFHMDLTANFSYNKNSVVFMDEPERAVPWQQRTGHPYGATLLYNAIGIFADQAAVDAYPSWNGAVPGDVIFEDVSGDGKITSDDKILLDGTDAPQTFYGIGADFTYKNWSLSLLVQGQGEYMAMNIADGRRGEAGNYFQWSFDDRWTPTNTDASVARAYNRDDLYWSFGNNNSTYHYDNMAYCRLKNAILNYNFPKEMFGSTGISAASVYVSANNLFLLYSAQKNFDPEVAAPMTYPALKTFAIGARISF